MSTTTDAPTKYTVGIDRYINFVEDFLGLTLAEEQKRILRAVAENKRVLIVSGNGVGKSYAVAALILAFLYTNVESTVLGTSGSYSQFVDTMWRPMVEMWKDARDDHDLPGRSLRGNSPELRIDDDWYAKVISPRDPGDLEGRHADHVLVVIEEADKEYITDRHFDSAGSSVTDENDRMVAVANPPEDEANVVYDKMQSDRWEVIQFSSFESHNVKFDCGDVDERLPGLVDLSTIRDDWEAWNQETWPGVEEARIAHEHRADLDERWYRRRAGVIPPDTAQVFRPFTHGDVADATADPLDQPDGAPYGVAIDVARRGGDWNVLAARYDNAIYVHERWQGVDHTGNMALIRRYLRQWNDPPTAVDAQGEGSALADMLRREFDVRRFNAGAEATEGSRFYDKWTEGLYHLGQFMSDGGRVGGEGPIADELFAASRTLELQEKHYASRDATVLKCPSKDVVEERLGRSPDILDAVYMAEWIAGPEVGTRSGQRLVW